MGSRDTSTVSSRGLAGRISKSNLSHERGQYLQSNTSLTNLSESLSTVMRSTERLTGARSSSDLDQLGVVMSPSGHNSTIVPAYRPAPDYETAVMSKYGGGGGGGGVNPQLAQLYSS